ncbi:MAG TPA: hypothetical protein VGS41_09730, partial [Chthonomonadales bacterium]|nr:hypothetical protein [Chthonomonadales bacterium]
DPGDAKYIDAVPDPALRETIRCAVTAYRRPDRLNPGDPAPNLTLTELGSMQPKSLSANGRPLFLIFGSYT